MQSSAKLIMRVKTLILTLAIILICSLWVSSIALAKKKPTLTLECFGPSKKSDIPPRIEVEYNGQGELALKGCEIVITYDPSIINYDFYGDTHDDFIAVSVKDSSGTVTIDGFFTTEVSGKLDILTLYFAVVAAGETDVEVSHSDLRGMSGEIQLFYEVDTDYTIKVKGKIKIEDAEAPTVDSVMITNDSAATDDYVKNGDNVTVIASGTELPDEKHVAGMDENCVKADLSGFGSSSEAEPDDFSYNKGQRTWNATWIVTGVSCNPADGEITVTIEVTDKAGNGPTQGTDIIIADNSAPTVDSVTISNDSVATDDYVKNGNNVTVTASGTDAVGIDIIGVTANLSSFYGGSGHTADTPDIFSYDEVSKTWQATWVVNSVTCNPADGTIDVLVCVTDRVGNGPSTGSVEITSDNTSPVIQNIAGIKTQDANGIALDKLDTTYAKNGDTVKITVTVEDSTANHNVISGIPAENPSNHIEADLSSLNDEVRSAPADYSNPPTTEWIVVLTNSKDKHPSISVTASDLVGNQSSFNDDMPINVDNKAPKNVTKFSVTPGSPVQLTWKFKGKYDKDYWGIRICRKNSVHFHGGEPASLGYPRYDDSTPGAYPVYRKGAKGATCYEGEIANHDSYYPANPNDEVLVDQQGDTESYDDTSVGQDIYYYQSYAYDKAGNLAKADTKHRDRDSATGYFLGDFDNNGQVNSHDFLALSIALGKDHTFEHWTDVIFGDIHYMDCDIGPTAATQTVHDGRRFGLPKTDGRCGFEDLMIFSMNFNNVPPAPMYEPTVFPENTSFVSLDSQQKAVAEGEIFPVALKLNPELKAKGAHLMLNYDARYFEVVSVTEGNRSRSPQDFGLTIFKAEDKGSVVDINVAALGNDVPLSDETIATVEFRPKGSAQNTTIYLSRIDVRGLRNEKADDKLANLGRVGLNLSVGKPDVTKVFHNYPNPFNPETWIPFQLEKETDVCVKIYDIKGQLVKVIKLENKPAGYYLNKEQALRWNGRNNAGERVSSGIYFYQFQAGKTVKTSKMAILK